MTRRLPLRFLFAVSIVLGLILVASPSGASAHRSGCHRWHSCPSDTGSYTCGDLGYYSQCPGGAPYTPPAPTYIPPVSPLAARPASSSQACGANGRIDVAFRWATSWAAAQQQWLDLSIFNNGFVNGSYLGAGLFSPSADVFTWYGLLPDTVHYWRVNTLIGGFWFPSGGYEFVTGHCQY